MQKVVIEILLPILNENFVKKNTKVDKKIYSVKIRYTYTVNTIGMCNRTKHFCASNSPNKGYCIHRKTFR